MSLTIHTTGRTLTDNMSHAAWRPQRCQHYWCNLCFFDETHNHAFMKTLLLFLLISGMAFGQSNEPFKHANTIIVKTALSDEDAFDTLCKNLVRHGYALENINKDYHQ